ncbi:unnamed protein product [Blepharisma stoltei]|uniref:C2 domain-containing protein n=1 Tax=Blepharisma stoltei TaxID=1481888 RepID=A0AAU9J317_9CILI|nr:unnamed protein product [Blepharisma stoltei]
MEQEVAKNPLNLAKWALASVDQKIKASPFQVNTRFALDPRISHERQLELRRAFKEIDADQSGAISFEEILNFLRGINDEVDENYVKTIFESMDVNKDGGVSIDEFINGYLEQVNGLSEAIARYNQTILAKNKELATLREQLEEAKKVERMNTYGIMEGSTFTVRVIEAQNLNVVTGRPTAYVNLICERQQIATKPIPSDKNPNWDETFSFKITMGTGELLVQVFNKGTVSKDDLLGTCSIPLQDFRDQAKHEGWYQLTGRVSNARIMLAIQWIHRQTEYLEGIISGMDNDIVQDVAEKDRVETELRKLGTNPLGMFHKESWVDRLESKIVHEVHAFTDQHFKEVGNWDTILTVGILMVALLGVCTSFDKPDFGNVTWACWAFMGLVKGWDTKRYRLGLIMLAIMILFDVLWIACDSEFLVFEMHSDPAINAKRFSFVMGFFDFVLKVLMFPVLVRCYMKSKEADAEALLNS